jgi:8-oxo-dGTP pyrophosphatase MutT (NUDIX family)
LGIGPTRCAPGVTVSPVKWTVHGERVLYTSEWVGLSLVDVEIPGPGGRRFEHHVVRHPFDAAGTIVLDPDRGVLLLWRHRFITDSWGYEVPAGRIDPGEVPIEAAARETYEETGWRPGPLEPLVRFNPSNGSSDQAFHIFVAHGATHVGEPPDRTEADRIEWVPVPLIREAIQRSEVQDGLSLAALCYALAFDKLN